MPQKVVIIIGAGPAGLTAAYELLHTTDIKPVIFEADDIIGGIARTVNYKGNRIDIGGHRFYSKSDRVVAWWQHILPLQGAPARDDRLLGRDVPVSELPDAPDPEITDRVMLVRGRLSRIFFLRKFFDYPLALKLDTFLSLGVFRMVRIGGSYVISRLFPIRSESSLEDFFINRFGRELYRTFFKSYTEKVWGVPCTRIKPEWGAQRIKGLSISKAVWHAMRCLVRRSGSIAQKNVETSLIDRFLYPKFGPGQMWEEVARQVQERGGELHLRHKVTGIQCGGNNIRTVEVTDEQGRTIRHEADYVISSMPVCDLIAAMGEAVPAPVRQVADGLVYRDFMTCGLLLKKLRIRNETTRKSVNDIVPDNWIYIQEPDVRVGRLQIFNNWSPYMVADPDTVWIGMEYFCDAGDDLWTKPDYEFLKFAAAELQQIGIIDTGDVLDGVVIRMPKTYPAYFGTYDRFPEIRAFTDGIENLFLIGRNGMHRYNNQDHSMLTAMETVKNIRDGIQSKDNIWTVNTEQEYGETKKE